jgi:hypothetical protein
MSRGGSRYKAYDVLACVSSWHDLLVGMLGTPVHYIMQTLLTMDQATGCLLHIVRYRCVLHESTCD